MNDEEVAAAALLSLSGSSCESLPPRPPAAPAPLAVEKKDRKKRKLEPYVSSHVTSSKEKKTVNPRKKSKKVQVDRETGDQTSIPSARDPVSPGSLSTTQDPADAALSTQNLMPVTKPGQVDAITSTFNMLLQQQLQQQVVSSCAAAVQPTTNEHLGAFLLSLQALTQAQLQNQGDTAALAFLLASAVTTSSQQTVDPMVSLLSGCIVEALQSQTRTNIGASVPSSPHQPHSLPNLASLLLPNSQVASNSPVSGLPLHSETSHQQNLLPPTTLPSNWIASLFQGDGLSH